MYCWIYWDYSELFKVCECRLLRSHNLNSHQNVYNFSQPTSCCSNIVSLQDAAVTYLNTGKSSKNMYLISDCSHTSTFKGPVFSLPWKEKSVLVTTININTEFIIYFSFIYILKPQIKVSDVIHTAVNIFT